jgi:hypothetical protein
MGLIKDEDDGAAEPLYTLSKDVHNFSSAKAARYSDRKRVRSIWIFFAICYLILIGIYVKLWIRLKDLESELHTMKPDLFPCMDTMVSL